MSAAAEVQEITTDVLSIGGGLAGVNAAIGALEQGAGVLVVDKGGIRRSGAIGGGVDHFMAFLESGPEWDTAEAYLEWAGRVARGAINLRVQEAIFCREVAAAIKRMDRIGNPLTQPDGSFYRTQSLGQPGPYFINFNGKKLKPRLAREARRLGSKFLERVSITDLLTHEGRVIGAVGFHIRNGNTYVIRSKATILATGNTNRLFRNPTGIPFNTWQCPADTGAAQSMAFLAGATLANMEYMRMTLVPKGFSAAGLNAFTGMGCRFINGAGEEFLHRYHPAGNKAPRYKLVEAVLAEVKEGRGPIFVDCRHLPESDLRHLKKTLGYDKDTLPDFLQQRGVDIAREPLEIMASEGMQGGPSEVCSSGIVIDEHCRSTVEGLFAAGDCADQTRCVHLCTTGGYVAGREAARLAQETGVWETADRQQCEARLAEAMAPLERGAEGIPYWELEETIRNIMWELVGPERTEQGLAIAGKKLEGLAGYLHELGASDLHQLMRVHETKQIWQVGLLSAVAARHRKESRFGAYHRRLDYPETDDRNWCGQVLLTGEDGGIRAGFRALAY